MNAPYVAFRADGWPLCPLCGEDELYSLAEPATIATIVGCYTCGFKPQDCWRCKNVNPQDCARCQGFGTEPPRFTKPRGTPTRGAKCDCTPAHAPSVIGACACPIHGMVALREAVDAALDWIENVTSWVGPGVPEDRDEVITQLALALNEVDRPSGRRP